MAPATAKRVRRGISAVEMAIVTPILLMLTLGVIEYGWMFLKSQEISNAARQGARVGITIDATTSTINAAVLTALTSAGLESSGYTVAVSADTTTLDAGDPLTVTITVAYHGHLELMRVPFLPTPTNLRSAVTMAKEGV